MFYQFDFEFMNSNKVMLILCNSMIHPNAITVPLSLVIDLYRSFMSPGYSHEFLSYEGK